VNDIVGVAIVIVFTSVTVPRSHVLFVTCGLLRVGAAVRLRKDSVRASCKQQLALPNFDGSWGIRFVNVTFYGVRGSTPCSSPETVGYGGNTSCIAVTRPGDEPLLLDLGTGLRQFGMAWPSNTVFKGNALVSHLHWDHVQGLPFFGPALKAGAALDVYAPSQDDGCTVGAAFDAFMRPPYFPITLEQLPADVRFHECTEGTFEVGGFTVTSGFASRPMVSRLPICPTTSNRSMAVTVSRPPLLSCAAA
jgi:hypothetical protein